MSRIIDYTLVSEASDDDVLIIDGLQGTRTVKIKDAFSTTKIQEIVSDIVDTDVMPIVNDAEQAAQEALASVDEKADYPSKSISGTVVSFDDGIDAPIKSLSLRIEPKQDLHGYDNPWTAGSGKNLRSGIDLANDFQNRIASATIDTTNKTVTFAYNAAETAGQYIPRNVTFKENTQYTFIITVLNPSIARANLCIAYTDGTTSNFPDLSAANAKETVTVTSTANKTVRSLAIKQQGGSSTIYYDESGVFEGANQSWTPYENLCPITGWTGTTVYRSGKNLWGGQRFADAILSSCTSAATQSGNIVTLPSGANNVQSSVANRAKMFENQFQDGSYTIIIGQPTDSASTLTNKSLITGFYTDGSSTSITAGHYDATNKLWRWVSNSAKRIAFLRMNRDDSVRQEYDITRMGIFQGNVSIEQFEAYNGAIYPITWETEAGTVYGGNLQINGDGSGTLTATHYCETTAALIARTWYTATSGGRTYLRARATSLMTADKADLLCSHYKYGGTGTTIYAGEVRNMISNYYNICFCDPANYTTVEEFTAFLQAQETAGTPVQLVHWYGTPPVYNLTAPQVRTILGKNNIWSNTDNIAVDYHTSLEDNFASKSIEPKVESLPDPAESDGDYLVHQENGQMTLIPATLFDKADTIVSSASGSVATFSDGANAPVKLLTVQVNPVQDLHGYDNPWPGGGGKNLLSPKLYSGGSYNPTVGTVWTLTESATQFSNPSLGVYTISFTSAWSTVVLICPVIQNEHYHVSYSGSTTSGIGRSWGYLDENFTVLTKSSETTTSFSYDATWIPGYAETTVNAAYIYLLITNRSSSSATITINNPQIEVGDAKTDYAPYENICPITGRTGAEVTRTGKNIAPTSVPSNVIAGTFTTASTSITSASNARVFAFKVPKQTTLTAQKKAGDTTGHNIALGDTGVLAVGTPLYEPKGFTNATSVTINTGNHEWMFVQSTNLDIANSLFTTSEFMVSVYPTWQVYTPSVGQTSYPITFPTEAGTVYGGALTEEQDGTWTLSVEWAKRMASNLTWDEITNSGAHFFTYTQGAIKNDPYRNRLLCSAFKPVVRPYLDSSTDCTIINAYARGANINVRYDACATLTDWNAYIAQNDFEIVWGVAPTTYTLTAQQVTTLLGQNNIWADTGDVAVEYRADTKLYIDNGSNWIPTALSNIIASSENDWVASRNYTAKELVIVNNRLYKVTANIASGGAITVGTNVTATTLSDIIKTLI